MKKLLMLPSLFFALVACGPQPEMALDESPSETSQSLISEQLPSQLPGYVNTSASPAIVSLNYATYVFYKGANDDPGIYVLRTYAPIEDQQWQLNVRLPGSVNTSDAPAVVTLNNVIYVFYKGMGSDSRIYVARSMDGTFTWSMTSFPSTINTSTRPQPYVSGNSLYVFYKGMSTDARMFVAKLPANTYWQPI